MFVLMKRKEQILQTALAAFNSKGYENVSTYDISRQMKISQGNLTYHFPTKKILINNLAKNMIAEIDEFILIVGGDFSIRDFYDNLYKTFKINLKYKFIYMNYSQIVLNDSDLNEYFMNNLLNRKELLLKILNQLIENGDLASESILPFNDRLSRIINMIAIYWVPESAIYYPTMTDEERIRHHLDLIFMPFMPYLSAAGKENLSLEPDQ
jgi:AcrR family transcriptional regulator